MPEPISSANPSRSWSGDADPSLDEAGRVCRADPPNSSPPTQSGAEPPPQPTAVHQLVRAVPPALSALPPSAGAPPAGAPSAGAPSAGARALTAENNAQRTTERSGISSYAEIGTTRGGQGYSAHAGVAALKGRDAKTGIEVEVFSASAQVGLQNEVQVGMARLGASGRHGSVTAEFFTARAAEGIHNDDGSSLLNVGAGINLANLEGTLNRGGNSLTFGLAIGAGAALSVGIRDQDEDGTAEKCIKATVGPVTLGICAED